MLLDPDTTIMKETEGYVTTINECLLLKHGWEHWNDPKQLKESIYYRHPDHPKVMIFLDSSGLYHLSHMRVYMDPGTIIDNMLQLDKELGIYKDVF